MRAPTAARAPVVSIGNLAMGGRGKTPVVAHVARLLVSRGERPAILSRGYARELPSDDVVVVSDGVHRLADLDRSGDEPLLLARLVPGASVLVCAVRARAAAVAEAELGATIHVLDDGFQHRSLERDVDVVIVTAGDLSDRRAPFGRLRSSVRSLARVHAVIIDGPAATDDLAALDRIIDRQRTAVFTLSRSLGDPWLLEPPFGAPAHPLTSAPAHRSPVVAMAGIERPERFAAALERGGWTVKKLVAFADHHRFGRRDIDRVREALAETGASAIVTTEKDAMRLLPLRPIDAPIVAVPLEVTVEPAPQFETWLDRQRERVALCRH